MCDMHCYIQRRCVTTRDSLGVLYKRPGVAKIRCSSSVTMADAVLLHRYWLVGSHKHSVRTLAPILPLPLWAWVWMSCFSPIYAVHLFPQQIVSEVTSPFIAKWVRFRPRTVNFACYGVPLVVGTLQITLGCVWPVIFSHGRRLPTFPLISTQTFL